MEEQESTKQNLSAYVSHLTEEKDKICAVGEAQGQSRISRAPAAFKDCLVVDQYNGSTLVVDIFLMSSWQMI